MIVSLGLNGYLIQYIILKEKGENVVDTNPIGDEQLYSYTIDAYDTLEQELTIDGEKNKFLFSDKQAIVNNKKLDVLDYNYVIPYKVYIYDNLIFFGIGTQENSYYYVYDVDGNLLKKFDDTLIKYANRYGRMTLTSDNKLVIEVINSNIAGPYINDDVYLCGCAQCNGDVTPYISQIEDVNNFHIANYEIIYDKENSEISLKLYNIKESLKDYYDERVVENGKWWFFSKLVEKD